MIGIIVNVKARGARDPLLPDRLVEALRRSPAGAGAQVRVTRTPDDLPPALADFMGRGLTLIGVCGGDGTTMATLTELVRVREKGELPPLLILRGGTINTVASNLGIRGRPELVLARTLRQIDQAGSVAALPFLARDLLQVRSRGPQGQGEEGPARYGFLFAAAMGARFLETYYDAPRPGLLSALLLMARTIASTASGGELARRLFAETEMELVAEGRKLPEDRYRMVVCATLPDVGLGMRVTWRAGGCPGRFHLVASRLPLSLMALQLPRVLLGRPLYGPAHRDQLLTAAHIRFPSPQPFTLDGDLFCASRVDLAIGPQVRLLGSPEGFSRRKVRPE